MTNVTSGLYDAKTNTFRKSVASFQTSVEAQAETTKNATITDVPTSIAASELSADDELDAIEYAASATNHDAVATLKNDAGDKHISSSLKSAAKSDLAPALPTSIAAIEIVTDSKLSQTSAMIARDNRDAVATLKNTAVFDLQTQDAPMAPAQDKLAYIRSKAKALVDAEANIADLEAQLDRAKAVQRKLRIEELPQIFFEAEIKSIGVGNMTVVIEPLVTASLSKDPDTRKKALDWCVDNKLGGNIKRQLMVDMPKGNAIMETKAVDALKLLGLKAEIDATIHHATYTAMCKRLVEGGTTADGKPIPKEILGIYVSNIARVLEDE